MEQFNRLSSRLAMPLFIVAVIFAATAVQFRLLEASFLSWDDDYNITKNPLVLSEQWTQIWSLPHYGMYIPVTTSIWTLLYSLSSGEAWSFRVLNWVLHSANIFLVYVLLKELLDKFRIQSRASLVLGVVVFGLHPLQVGTYAWISGGRDLLSTFFGLLAVLFYISSTKWRASILATFFFTVGLLCKPQIAALPVALWVFIFFFDRTRLRHATLMSLVWCALALAAAMITLSQQADAIRSTPLWSRPIVAIDAYGFYLLKILWPFDLSTDYGRTPWLVAGNPQMIWPSVIAVSALVASVYTAYRKDRRFLILALWVILLAPVSGIVDFAFQLISTVADHYNYMALGVAAAVAAMTLSLLPEGRRGSIHWGIVLLISLSFVFASWSRAEIWKDDQIFFQSMLEKNPNSYTALVGVGGHACSKGQDYGKGVQLFSRSLALRPLDPVSIANLSVCRYKGKLHTEVIEMERYLREEKLLKDFGRHDFAAAGFLSALGSSFAQVGQIDKGFFYLCQANAINPYDRIIVGKTISIINWYGKKGVLAKCGERLDLNEFATRALNFGK